MDYHFLLLNVNSDFIEKKSPHYIVCGICGGLNHNTLNQEKNSEKLFFVCFGKINCLKV
jgi:hypothetical protein